MLFYTNFSQFLWQNPSEKANRLCMALYGHCKPSCFKEGWAPLEKPLSLQLDLGWVGSGHFCWPLTPTSSRGKAAAFVYVFLTKHQITPPNEDAPGTGAALESRVNEGKQQSTEEKERGQGRTRPEKGRLEMWAHLALFRYCFPGLQMENRTEHPWLKNVIHAKNV